MRGALNKASVPGTQMASLNELIDCDTLALDASGSAVGIMSENPYRMLRRGKNESRALYDRRKDRLYLQFKGKQKP